MLKLTKGIELAANTIIQKCDVKLSENRLHYESQ